MREAVSVDLSKPYERAAIRLREGEAGSLELMFAVTSDGAREDLSVYDSVTFEGSYPGGEVREACSIEEGYAVLACGESMTRAAGRYGLAYLALASGESVITTQSIAVEVLPGVEGYGL